MFDSKYYLNTYKDIQKAGIDPLKHFIKVGVKEGKNPNAQFDTKFYLNTYPEVAKSKMNPLVHYILYGKNDNRDIFLMKKNNKSDEILNIIYNYLKKNNIEMLDFKNTKDLEVRNYLKDSKNKNILIPKIFSSELYEELYPDIKKNQMNPLYHFFKYGMNEGRIGYLDFKKYIKKGKCTFNEKKDVIAIVHHESSATGAPLLGFNISKSLNTNYNIINIVIKKSNIHESFYDESFLVLENVHNLAELLLIKLIKYLVDEYSISCFVCNSIVTNPILMIANKLNIATLSLIHEFAEYTRPKNKILNTIISANKVILPAKIIQDSIMEQLIEVAGIRNIPSNIEIKPQGKLPYLPEMYGESDAEEIILKKLNIESKENYKIIVASGYAQIRKGVDLFIYIARYIKNYYESKCKFVWVGDGFCPENDFSYSLWLKREIKHLGLENDFIFLEHQKSLNNIFSIADVFCLTSRMDPFPNVVIDALEANLPIACFRDASGSVEFLEENNAECIIADYLDTHQLGEKIYQYLENNKIKKEINKQIVAKKLDFNSYINYIEEKINEAKVEQKEILKKFDLISKSDFFDIGYVSLNNSKEKIYYGTILILIKKGLYENGA